MSDLDEIWVPLVDEPIGSIVEQVQTDDPAIERLVGSPARILAFRTFAYIRVGIVLGQLLVDHDLEPYDGTDTWVGAHLRRHRLAVPRVAEQRVHPGVRAVVRLEVEIGRAHV